MFRIDVYFPRGLHSESSLEIRFGALQIAEHKYTRPRTNGNACCELTARESNGLCFERISHCLIHGLQSLNADTRTCACAHDNFVIVIKYVLLFGKQICHSVARRNVWKQPKCMGENGQKHGVSVRHIGFARTEFQLVRRCAEICATDEIQPLLHVVFVFENGVFSRAFRREKHVEIKLVKLALLCDFGYAVGDFVRHHNHARKRGVRIVFPLIILFCTLLVGVSPTVYLIFHKLTVV